MCYDKIESGILVLHKEDVTPLPFLQECFNGFRAEAQERGVTLNFNPPSGDLPPFTVIQYICSNETTNPFSAFSTFSGGNCWESERSNRTR